ncbi:hypothetical protein PAXRUDRAFT_29292, partial [Paxillus rubicundulus Ve08.2h10]
IPTDNTDAYDLVTHSSPPQLSIQKLGTPGYNTMQPVNTSNVTAHAGHRGIRDQRRGFGGEGEHQDKEEGRHGGSDRVDNEAAQVDEGRRRQRGDNDDEGEGNSTVHRLNDNGEDEGNSARLGGGGVDYNNETEPNNIPRKPAASDSTDDRNGGGTATTMETTTMATYLACNKDGVTKDSEDSENGDTKGGEDNEPEVDETGENKSKEDRPRLSSKSFKQKGKPHKPPVKSQPSRPKQPARKEHHATSICDRGICGRPVLDSIDNMDLSDSVTAAPKCEKAKKYKNEDLPGLPHTMKWWKAFLVPQFQDYTVTLDNPWEIADTITYAQKLWDANFPKIKHTVCYKNDPVFYLVGVYASSLILS